MQILVENALTMDWFGVQTHSHSLMKFSAKKAFEEKLS